MCLNIWSSLYHFSQQGLLDPDPPRRGGGEEGVPGGPETLLQLRPLPGHGGPRQDMLSGRVVGVVSPPMECLHPDLYPDNYL